MSDHKRFKLLDIKHEDKLWGLNHVMHLDGSFQVCHISVKKGGFCSNHRHTHKWNQFYVVSGKLAVQTYRGGELTGPPETIHFLGPTDSIRIEPGVNHKFHALEDTEAIEIYSASVSEEDIIREDTGGMMS